MTYKYVATCLFGLEALLGGEIDRLGYRRIETLDGRIIFEGDEGAAARANIMLRFAERVFLLCGEFTVKTFDELFESVRTLPMEEYIGKTDEYPVSGHSIKSTLYSVPDCQKIIKKAVSVRLSQHYGISILPESGVKKKIEFFILKDRCMLMIDLTGTPLHKRGYRPETVTAPLRETLAAAIAATSRPREGVLLRDPFCGSGTILIEGAMMMKNISPGINRSFISERNGLFPAATFVRAREEARDNVVRDSAFDALGSDTDSECVRIARESAERAGVGDIVKFKEMNALDITTEGRRGTIVSNPPYGERLLTEAECEKLYRDMGVAWKKLENWQLYILTPQTNFPTLFGRRADKIRKLYNGMIPCFLYQFFKNERRK